MESSNSNWLDAPKQAIVVGAYLVVVITSSIITIFVLFPKVDLDNSVKNKREFTVPVIADSLNLHVEFQPDIAAALTDTVAMKFQVLDRAGKRIYAIPETSLSIPAETIPNYILLLLVLLAGALGASLYGLTSLVEYVGNQSYVNSWTMWYLLRPFAGGVLALVFYLAGRAGLFDVIDTSDELYGILALAGLIGLFSKQALFKLSDIFDVLFRSAKEDTLKDKLRTGVGTVPMITGIQPSSLVVNAQDRTIVVKGNSFADDAGLLVNGRELVTTRIDENSLSTELDESDVAAPTSLQITVRNPGPLELFSKPAELKVEPIAEVPNAEEPIDEPPSVEAPIDSVPAGTGLGNDGTP